MANRALLINSTVLNGDPAVLELSRISNGNEYVFVAEGANRIPVPWMLCFQESDLQTITVELTNFDGVTEQFTFNTPRTSLSSAKENLRQRVGVMEEITGNSVIAREYWQAAIEGLESLPLPYLTIDPLEVLLLNDPVEEAEAFTKCFSGSSESFAFLKRLAFFEDGHEPYSLDDYRSKPPEQLDNLARIGNAAALDASFLPPEFRLWHRRD